MLLVQIAVGVNVLVRVGVGFVDIWIAVEEIEQLPEKIILLK
jgi:hypothetical protein